MSKSGIAGQEFDIIIVGGGSAGCVLAGRLSEDPRLNVLLIEAGADTPPGAVPPEIQDINIAGAALASDKYIWPELEVNLLGDPGGAAGRAFYEQGRVLGGGSSVNIMAANRGLPRDYDQWAAAGATGWDWKGILPAFKKLERDLDFTGPLHGVTGPIPIRRESETGWPPFIRATAAGLRDLGLLDIGDQNAVFRDGFFRPAQSNENGRRGSAAGGYLNAETRRRPNLTLLTQAFVEAINFEGNRASGVALERAGERFQLHARAEVILTAGALHTPALLLRAGIGPAAQLTALGIPLLADRPGVGENLSDHPANFVGTAISEAAGRSPTGDGRHGLAVRLSSGVDPLVLSDLYLVVGTGIAGLGTASFGLWLNKPSSKGRLTLASRDPHQHPEVDFNLLSDARDIARFHAGFSFIEKLTQQSDLAAHQPAVAGIPARMSFTRPTQNPPPPVPLATLLLVPEQLEGYLRQSVKGLWHASGTARIGAANDPLAVTDPAGRVYGVTGLRVADASLFPAIPTANTNLPTIAAAEKIAALILAQPATPAAIPEKVFS